MSKRYTKDKMLTQDEFVKRLLEIFPSVKDNGDGTLSFPPLEQMKKEFKQSMDIPESFDCFKKKSKKEEPSLAVNPAKHCFYCFKCNKGGDLISFLCAIEKISQFDALELLIKDYLTVEERLFLPKLVKTPSFTAESHEEAQAIATKWSESNDPYNSFETCANYVNTHVNISTLIHLFADASIYPETKEQYKCLCPFCEKDKNA